MAAVGRADRLPSGPKTCNRGPEHHDPGRHPERAFPPSPFALLARGLRISPLSGQVKPSSTSNETRTRYRYEKGLVIYMAACSRCSCPRGSGPRSLVRPFLPTTTITPTSAPPSPSALAMASSLKRKYMAPPSPPCRVRNSQLA
ncbi:hypothetical protein K523DRAFT_358812 [Schizophyllum commune Tattone D]|nr:hypothetical protein K523DRAFT_358812 [Schizophyllum commune Tattone D]